MCRKLSRIALALVVSLVGMTTAYGHDVIWDFENGNDHGFALAGLKPGVLPEGGSAWSIGQPDQYDGQVPAVVEGCHMVDVNDANGVPINVLQYGPCNDPFGAAVGDPPYDFTNGRGQSSYLNTYNQSQWGDNLHIAENDQIATSRPVLLYEGAHLTTWAFGNTSADWAQPRMAPELDPNTAEGYVTGSGGIAVLSADDGSLLASLLVAAQDGDGNMPREFSLDLSDFAGQRVVIEAVDAFAGGWGWLCFDEIRITNAIQTDVIWDFENGNDHGFALASLKPGVLPEGGIAWSIGQPDQYDGQVPAVVEGCHMVDVNDANGVPIKVLQYGPCNDPFGAAVGDPPYDFTNGRGQSSYLNTYNLSQWGDNLHLAENDQVAT
ncbi:MAG TPA: hypothetical protein VMW24_05700, partial [Sedimentisphaerales bacterium]|nr:hypothetical protein [Sedimentisphaerales bacterium]